MADPTPADIAARLPRFLRHVDEPDANGCRRFTGSLDRLGYGQVGLLKSDDGRSRTASAHRFRWIAEHGPIPQGLHVLHSCDVRDCVALEHMRLGTAKENVEDMDRRGRRPKRMPRRDPLVDAIRACAPQIAALIRAHHKGSQTT